MEAVAPYSQTPATAGQTKMASAGTIMTSKANGDAGKALMVETGLVQDRQNNIMQFSIDNTGAGNAAQFLRIGSWASEPDHYTLVAGLSSGASDDAVITDQVGTGCKAVQAFSRITIPKPVLITKVKIITPTATAQLQQPIKYRSLQLDGTLDEITNNIAFTQAKQDQRENLVEKVGVWILDAQQFIEYQVLAGATVDIFLEVSAFNSTVGMKAMMKS